MSAGPGRPEPVIEAIAFLFRVDQGGRGDLVTADPGGTVLSAGSEPSILVGRDGGGWFLEDGTVRIGERPLRSPLRDHDLVSVRGVELAFRIVG